jgi:hypothetical protein
MRSLKLAVAAALVLGAIAARGDDAQAPTPESVAARLEDLDLKGAEAQLAKLKSDAKTPAAKDAAKGLEKELEIAKKLLPVSKKMEKFFADKKMRECYGAYMAAVDAYPGAVGLRGMLKQNAREARKQAYLVVDDFDGGEAAKEGEAKGADGAPAGPEPKAGEKAKPKKPPVKWTAQKCAGELVADPMGGWALHWTADAGVKRAYWDKPLKEPLDLGQFEFISIRVRATKVPKTELSMNFSDGGKNWVEADLKFEPDGKWHELHFPVGDLKRVGALDESHAKHAVLFYMGGDPLEVEVDEILLAKKTKS